MKLRRGADIALLLQAALIVAPLALLSVVAIRFLRQDRAAIRLEAQTSAQPVATEAVQWAARDALPLIERILQSHPELQGVIANSTASRSPTSTSVSAFSCDSSNFRVN